MLLSLKFWPASCSPYGSSGPAKVEELPDSGLGNRAKESKNQGENSRMANYIKILCLGLISLFVFANPAFADAFSDAISVPEPASVSLFALGAMILVRKFKQKK